MEVLGVYFRDLNGNNRRRFSFASFSIQKRNELPHPAKHMLPESATLQPRRLSSLSSPMQCNSIGSFLRFCGHSFRDAWI